MATVNDREWKFLAEQTGLSLPFNDLYFRYLRDLGYEGTLQDMIAASGFGLVPSQHSGPPPEPINLITNGTFDTDTDWTKGDGWSITGGVAVGAPAALAGDLSQPVVLPAGNYRCEFDVVSRAAGQVRFVLKGGAGSEVVGTLRNAVGHYSEDISTIAQTTFAMRKTTTFNGSIDNVELYYLD
jgi:hypothetical protein